MRDRRAKDGHDRVADELLHRASEPLELRAQARVVRSQDRAYIFRVQSLRARRRANQVSEQHGYDLALLTRRLRWSNSRAAAGAEACLQRHFASTVSANGHDPIVARTATDANAKGATEVAGTYAAVLALVTAWVVGRDVSYPAP